jgi:predicted naringenin-chalcone synthase
MSSATILFVLRRALSGLRRGEFALGIGFGPGFAVELSLWRGLGRNGA